MTDRVDILDGMAEKVMNKGQKRAYREALDMGKPDVAETLLRGAMQDLYGGLYALPADDLTLRKHAENFLDVNQQAEFEAAVVNDNAAEARRIVAAGIEAAFATFDRVLADALSLRDLRAWG